MVFFTVRSAYKIAMDHISSDQAGSISDGGSMHLFWRKLWKINVPHKIRHFAWKAAWNILPTKANLIHHHVLLDDTCEEYGLKSESLVHFFWECPKVKELWALIDQFRSLNNMHFQNFVDFLWYL